MPGKTLQKLTSIAIVLIAAHCFASPANAQGGNCTVTGTIYRPNGSPALNETVTIVKVFQNGAPVGGFTSFSVVSDPATGFVTFTVPAGSTAWVQATNVVGLNRTGGVPLAIPAADTATLEMLMQQADGVTSFNTRLGDVALSSGDVTGALGYTPANSVQVTSVNGRTGDVTLNSTDINNSLGYAPVNPGTTTTFTSPQNIAVNSTSNAALSLVNQGGGPVLSLGQTGFPPAIRLQTTSNTAPFSIQVGGGPFNGVMDDVLYWGFNNGNQNSQIQPGVANLGFQLESDYFHDGRHDMEWNFDFINPSGNVRARPMSFFLARDAPSGAQMPMGWGFTIGNTSDSQFIVWDPNGNNKFRIGGDATVAVYDPTRPDTRLTLQTRSDGNSASSVFSLASAAPGSKSIVFNNVNVGINTPNPDSSFVNSGVTKLNNDVLVGNPSPQTAARLMLTGSNDTSLVFWSGYGAGTNPPTLIYSSDLRFGTAAAGSISGAGFTERARLTNAGKLIVSGISSQAIYGGSATASTLTLAGSSSSTPVGANVLINPAGGGFVGIGNLGAAAPASDLHIAGNTPFIRLQNTAPGGQTMTFFAGTTGVGIGTPSTSNQFVLQSVAPSNALLVGDAGGTRITIGTSQGVQSAKGTDMQIKSDSMGTTGRSVRLQGWNGSVWQDVVTLPNVASGNVNLQLVPNGGNVGVGTATPVSDALIDIAGGDTRGLRIRPRSVAGAPTNGTWSAGTMIVDSAGIPYICTVGGTPGTWQAQAGTGGGGASGVSSFDGRAGAITLNNSDVTTALGYTPISPTNSPNLTLVGTGSGSYSAGGVGNVTLTINKGTGASSALDIFANTTGYAMRIYDPANLVSAQAYFTSHGGFLTAGYINVSGHYTGTGDAYNILFPSTDPGMFTVWSDILGPAVQVRGQGHPESGSYLFSGMDGAGNRTFSIEENGQLRWGASTRAAMDTNLYRDRTGTLRTGGSFVADGAVGVGTNAPAADAMVDVSGGDNKGFRIRPRSSAGAPTSGTWSTGTIILDSSGTLYICVAGGAPGTWQKIIAQ